ncbi:ribosomal biogenesis regulatory protein [Xylariaceae sp. FL0662B]|nr:ribosomal biogenesis regulatory protein [Xylariaceae sp. FL0662B]
MAAPPPPPPPPTSSKPNLDISVAKPTPYTFDLGLLLANDANPLTPSSSSSPTTTTTTTTPSSTALEARLATTARDGAQALINQILTTLPLSTTSSGVLATLPPATTLLPREKPVPEARVPTRWEQFAARRGIRPRTREQRRAKGSAYNEETGAWERTWGYDRGHGAERRRRDEGMVQRDWLVEVDGREERERKEREVEAKTKAGSKAGKGKGSKKRKA